MDFTSILNTLNTLIPPTIMGIDSLYIVAGVVVVLLLILVLAKRKSKAPKRELMDIEPESSPESESEIQTAETEEEGFMPQDIHVSDEEDESSENPETMNDVQETAEFAEEPQADTEVAEAAPQPVTTREPSNVVRKKRESTRNGRKIAKADFADFSGQRLLIAEDNLINQKVINGVLNESGIDVVMADDGQIVMEILEKDSDFEIILMDAHMPRMDGFEATRAIRQNPDYDHIVVVALSGDTASDDIRHMNEAGMEEHLEKPLKMDALYDVMSMYYSMNEPEEQEDVIERAPQELEIAVDIDDMACLDYDLGLEICGNDEGMYKELLKEFFIGYKDSSKRMHAALVAKDYAGAQAILVDVKGTASNLGAKQFITITERFLEALANDEKAKYGKLFNDYQKYLLALLKSIQQAFKV